MKYMMEAAMLRKRQEKMEAKLVGRAHYCLQGMASSSPHFVT